MKRIVVCLCLCGVLALPAIAIAQPFPPDSHFQGRVEGDPSTYFGFGTTDSKRHKKVRHLAVALPMSCYDGTQGIEEVWIHGHFNVLSLRQLITGLDGVAVAPPAERSALVARGRAAMAKRGGHPKRGGHLFSRLLQLKIFFVEAEVTTDKGIGEAEVYGTIRRHGKASGRLKMTTRSDATGKCYSGGLKWRAHRGAHVDYPPTP